MQPPKILPSSSARLIQKICNWNQNLLLGILQFRTLGKAHNMLHLESALTLLSDTLFWEGYEIWKKRKALVTNFWQNIAPKDWKIAVKEKKGKGKRKMRPNCKNPFHYFEKFCDLSKQRRTPCLCSDVQRKPAPLTDLPDIRTFLTKYPKQIFLGSNTNLSNRGSSSFKHIKDVEALTQTDLIRKQHDRGKRKKPPL